VPAPARLPEQSFRLESVVTCAQEPEVVRRVPSAQGNGPDMIYLKRSSRFAAASTRPDERAAAVVARKHLIAHGGRDVT